VLLLILLCQFGIANLLLVASNVAFVFPCVKNILASGL
jgi:hypothetical protein